MINNLISIIIPLYNKENSIDKTISSIINQTYSMWELIVVDDGSTDHSADCIKKYLEDKRIKYIYKKNGGVSSARNLGIKKSNGNWIMFIDADDYFLPNALEILYSLVIKNESLVSTANFYIEKCNNRKLFCLGDKEKNIDNNYKSWFYREFFPRTGNTLFHYSILKDHLFDESLSRYEDAKSLFDIFRVNRISYTPFPVMVYSLDDNQLSKRSSNIDKDFIFKIEFERKLFWEKIVLCELILQGYKTYPDQSLLLKKMYGKYNCYMFVTKVLSFWRRINVKLNRIW